MNTINIKKQILNGTTSIALLATLTMPIPFAQNINNVFSSSLEQVNIDYFTAYLDSTNNQITKESLTNESSPTIMGETSLVSLNTPTIDLGSNKKIVREMIIPTSAYNSEVGQTDDSPYITADGSHVRWGIVAANFLPIGTQVRIPDYFGDQIFEVHDRMNKRYTYKMDLWMADKSDARAWGVRNVKIEILG